VIDLDDHPFEAPTTPLNDREQIEGNFLHAGGHYLRKLTYMLSADDVTMLNDKRMWLVGYVDYTDAFEVRHRVGFCRSVLKGLEKKNNLTVDRTSVSYNYDREIDENGNEKGQRERQPHRANAGLSGP
jgi:hypothetical protein